MNKTEIEVLVESLKIQLNETDKMWDEKKSHAMIIGYLQGTIKAAITYLEDNVKK